MSNPEVVIAIYRPKDGKTSELESLVKNHFSTLHEYGLVTDHKPFLGRSADGSLVEIFEWVSKAAAEKAHDHPAVAKIWEAMALVCEFGRLEQMAEAKNIFPHFPRAF